jgi:hypothetical protein
LLVQLALKLHRLGRTSFRNVRQKRDYLRSLTASYNWLHLSKLSALKEFAFMRALGEHGFPVPRACELNRHAVLMSLVPATPLTQVRELANPPARHPDAERTSLRRPPRERPRCLCGVPPYSRPPDPSRRRCHHHWGHAGRVSAGPGGGGSLRRLRCGGGPG